MTHKPRSLVRLGQFIALQRGYDLPEQARLEGTIPVVTSSGITGYHQEAAEKGPGVITGRYGTIGEVHYVEGDYWPHNTTLFVKDFKGNNPVFIRNLLLSLNLAHQVSSGAVPGVNRNILHEMLVPDVELPEQQRIADTLSAYDYLIENNRRRIALLEDAARQLYQEWFVRLRFPGAEHTRIIDGVPEGWKRNTLSSLCESIDYGYTESAVPEPIGPKFLRITDIVPSLIDWSSVPHCPIEDAKLEKYRLAEGDIVVARTGATVGYAKRLNKNHPESVFASYLVRLRVGAEIDNLIAGTYVESDEYKQYVRSQVGGAAQPNANAKVLSNAELLVPPKTIQDAFREFVEPIVDQREKLQQQNEKLKQARDLLLPHLMSGG